jgi:methionyl aminopeptidase
MSACEAVRERGVKILNKEEIEGMRKVCRVSSREVWTARA